jgi:perosamine synthetase
MGGIYHAAFKNIECVQIAPAKTSYSRNVYWVFALVIKPSAAFSRDDLITALTHANIGTRTFFYGLHEQPALLNSSEIGIVSLPNTEHLSRCGLYLPSGLGLSKNDQCRVIDVAVEFISNHT